MFDVSIERQKFYVIIKDRLILKKHKEIAIYSVNNYEFLFKFTYYFNSFKIYPLFNEKYFNKFYIECKKAKFQLYNVNPLKKV